MFFGFACPIFDSCNKHNRKKTILYCLFRIQHLCRHRTLNLIKNLKSLRSSSRLKHIWLVYMQVKTDPKVFHNKYTWMVFLQVMDDATNVQEELSLSSKSRKFQICKSLVPPSYSWWPSKRPPPLSKNKYKYKYNTNTNTIINTNM